MPIKIEIKDVRLVPVSEIKRDPENRNKHPKDQIDELARHYKVHGMRTPLIVSNQTGFLRAGDGRYQAAIEAEMTHVPVSFQDFESELMERAWSIADNGLSLWSELDMIAIQKDAQAMPKTFDLNNLGIKNFDPIGIETLTPMCDEDDMPEKVEPKSKLGDVYQLGRHRLICGDSLNITNIEKLMNGEKADMVFTDPPYNVAYEGKTKDALTIQNDKMDGEAFYQFLYDAYTAMFMHTKAGGAIYVAHADTEGANFRKAMKDAGWLLKQCIVWVKNTIVMGRQDYHWKHEPILYGWAPGASHNWYSDRKQSTVFECAKPQRNAEHPTMKPVELVEYFLGNSCPPNGLILDPFGGSGSTLIAAEKSGKRANLCEIDPKYCDVIVARWEKYTGKIAERING
jgi:DNA modification methylase